MILQLALGWLASFVGWLGGLVSIPGPPAMFSDLSGYIGTASQYVASTGAWLPWPIAVTMAGAWAAMFLASVSFKVIRILASYLTLGGGSAG